METFCSQTKALWKKCFVCQIVLLSWRKISQTWLKIEATRNLLVCESCQLLRPWFVCLDDGVFCLSFYVSSLLYLSFNTFWQHMLKLSKLGRANKQQNHTYFQKLAGKYNRESLVEDLECEEPSHAGRPTKEAGSLAPMRRPWLSGREDQTNLLT